MNLFLQSVAVLAVIVLIARFIKRGSPLLKRFFIPSSLVAGVIGLILGPQVLGAIPQEITGYWASWPKYLITVVFAGLFLGKIIPGIKEIWRMAGPQIAFGNTLAWGQYVLGIGLTLAILVPFFGATPLAGALIEIGFEGGHGTAAGLAPTFQEVGWSEGTDIALALATVSIIMAIVIGIVFVNWHNRRVGAHHPTPEEEERIQRQLIRSGYNLITFGRKIKTSPRAAGINVLAFAIAISAGWLMLEGLIWLEDILLGPHTDMRLFPYLPLFPMAMIGGLLLQVFLRKIHKQTLIQRRTAEIISTLALDILIASAVSTISLSAISHNLPVFICLAIAGIVWIVAAFWFLAPRMFPTYWFEKGVTNMGQSMGMTATGLLLNRLADPSNKTHARESFAYKQLVFEPFMGGGIVTAGMLVFIYEFGAVPMLIVSSLITLFWLFLGFWLFKRHHSG